MKFFEIIPPGTKFPFVRSAKYFIFGSILMLLGTIGAMAFNASTRGSVLNLSLIHI